MTIRFRMSSIMGVIEPEQLELFALVFEKFCISICLHYNINKYQPISSKIGQNINDPKISDEFDYECNQTRTNGVICP